MMKIYMNYVKSFKKQIPRKMIYKIISKLYRIRTKS